MADNKRESGDYQHKISDRVVLQCGKQGKGGGKREKGRVTRGPSTGRVNRRSGLVVDSRSRFEMGSPCRGRIYHRTRQGLYQKHLRKISFFSCNLCQMTDNASMKYIASSQCIKSNTMVGASVSVMIGALLCSVINPRPPF